MNNSAPPVLNNPENKIQWNSPFLILSGFLAFFVLGAGVFMFLIGVPKKPTREISPEGLIVSDIGFPVNQEKTVTEVNQLLSSARENDFLTFSYLRKTYGGGLVSVTTQPAANPDDPALILVITKGNLNDTLTFSVTLAEMEKLRISSVGGDGSGPIFYNDLQAGDGISITRITDLMGSINEPDEILIEVVKQPQQ